MNTKVARNRFIVSSLKRYGGFYQQLFRGVSGFEELGRRLIGLAETAIAFRQTEEVEEAGLMLSRLPIKEYQRIGHYYCGWCAYRKRENTQKVFEEIVETSTTYKARALISLAAVASGKGDYTLGSRYYAEAIRIDSKPSIVVPALRSIAVIKSMDGSHKHALADLEKIAPLARYANPVVYFDYLNSLAVELAEVGRIEEARNISNIVLACPYAFAYPEWRETREDIERKAYRLSRSTVSFAQKPVLQNVLYLPERSNEEYSPSSFQPQGIVVKLNTWKSKMVKEPNDTPHNPLTRDQILKLSRSEKRVRVVDLVYEDDLSEETLAKILEVAEDMVRKDKGSI